MEPRSTHHLSARDAESALKRAREDGDWLAWLRREYRGRHEVLDALWWVAHPGAATPAGLADPASELRHIQRAVYSRESAGSPIIEIDDPDEGGLLRMREAEHRLLKLQRLLAEDRQMLERAYLATRPNSVGTAPAQVLSVSPIVFAAPPRDGEPGVLQPDQPVTEPQPVGHDALPTATRGRKLLPPALAAVAIIVAIVVLPSVSGMNTGFGSAPTPTPSTISEPITPHTRTEIVTFVSDGNVSDPFAVLERPQAEADQPRVGLEHGHLAGSFRKLPDLVAFLQLYLARGEQGETICLVVLREDDSTMGSCVTDDVFATRGIELGLSGGQYRIGTDMTILTEWFTLSASGDIQYTATARRTASAPDVGTIAPQGEKQFLGS